MYILVDYDNIHELDRNRGLVSLVGRMVDALGAHLVGESELNIRFYGGWFDGAGLSRRAQRMSPTLRAEFPRTVSTTVGSDTLSFLARAELALSLISAPGKYLTHTYRERASIKGIRSQPLPYSNCVSVAACPLAPVHNLLRDSHCPEQNCPVELDGVFLKPEQKLVDTMLALDAAELSRNSGQSLAVVSTDDDMWPAIVTACLQGTKVVHLHPVPGRRTPAHYLTLAGPSYDQCSF